MAVEQAPGLPADWLNGWLAAVGVTVLSSEVQLSWTDHPVPLAMFHHPGEPSLAERIAEALPDLATLKGLVLAELPRNVTLMTFRAAAGGARDSNDSSLALSTSDLVSGKLFDPDDLPHGGFDPPAPKGTTLLSRVLSCRQLLEPNPAKPVGESLAGLAVRKKNNGLGFDIRRIPSGVQPGAKVMVDPAIECLAFAALKLFPVRGNGRRMLQKGWIDQPTRRGAFSWPVWSHPLDAWAIEALLDRFYADPSHRASVVLSVTGAFASVPFQPTGSNDVTRGYGSERIA